MPRDLRDLQQDMANQQAARTTDKQSHLSKQYDTEMEGLKAELEEVKDQHRTKLAAIRTAQLDRLRDLVQRKAELEITIQKEIDELSMAHQRTRDELKVAMAGRADDLKDGIDALEVGAEAESEDQRGSGGLQ